MKDIRKELELTLSKGEMVRTQLDSWELILRKQKLADSTIHRKIHDTGLFYAHMHKLRANGEKIDIHTINKILFEYVRDDYFSLDNLENEGTVGYRRSIHKNIKDGLNYIYEEHFGIDVLIKDLIVDQKEILDDISKNKFFRCNGQKDNKHTIQTKLIEDLGIKVYFDESDEAYVYSHELAETINIENKHINQKIKKLTNDLVGQNFDRPLKCSNFNISEDNYIDCQNKTVKTYKMYKDMVILYLMDTSAQGKKRLEMIEFKMRYIDAFNYIEQEHNRLLEEYAELKESFMKMYNGIRKRNRELLIAN